MLKNVNSILEPGAEQRARGKVRGVEMESGQKKKAGRGIGVRPAIKKNVEAG